MSTIVTRAGKGSALTWTEADANFNNLNTDKLEINPALGTPVSGVLTNCTGTAAGLTAGNVTTNANLTGGVTSVGNTATVVTNANLTGHVTSTGNAAVLGSFTLAQLNTAVSDADVLPLAGGNLTGGINGKLTTVASHATTADIFATTVGNLIDWTGAETTTIFPNAPQAGAERTLVCAGAAVFTAGVNMLIDGVASGSNFTAAAGDKIIVRAVSTTQFRLTPQRYNGSALPAVSATTTISSGNITTTSPSLVDLTGATVTLTTVRGGPCAFSFVCTEANNTANTGNVFNINVDGTLLFGTGGIVASETDTINDEHHFTLSGITAALTAGSHTIKVQWKVNAASTGTVIASAASAPRLSVWEI